MSLSRGVTTSSHVNEQPEGFAEIFSGAVTRARSARTQRPGTIAIGIESGIICFNDIDFPITFDIAIVVVYALDGRRIVTTSSAIPFPEDCVAAAKERGFATTTVGSVIAERFGGDPADPHLTLTGGKLSRKDTLTDALVAALKQL